MMMMMMMMISASDEVDNTIQYLPMRMKIREKWQIDTSRHVTTISHTPTFCEMLMLMTIMMMMEM